jgi:hypothetical protein
MGGLEGPRQQIHSGLQIGTVDRLHRGVEIPRWHREGVNVLQDPGVVS